MAFTRKASKDHSIIILLIIGTACLGLGSISAWKAGIIPIQQSLESNHWPRVSCQIIRSEVKESIDENDTDQTIVYEAMVLSQYIFRGHTYNTGRYTFGEYASSKRNDSVKTVAKYPLGTTHTCFVNPANPAEAVLNRNIVNEVWIFLVASLTIAIVGAGLLLFALGAYPKRWQKNSHTRVSEASIGFTALFPEVGAGQQLIGSTVLSATWNGLLLAAFYHVWSNNNQAMPDLTTLLILSPFVLVGSLLLFINIRIILSSFNPRPSLFISEGAPRLGQPVVIEIFFSQRSERISNLSLSLKGTESAQYKEGSNTRTDHNVFFDQEIFDAAVHGSFEKLQVSFQVPNTSMHTFKGKHNAIDWSIELHAEIRRWTDISESYPLVVRPLPIAKEEDIR